MNIENQDQINRYCESVTSAESTFLQVINHFTWKKMLNPRMLSGHLQGRFLSQITAIQNPSCILEIGTFTGYSTACFLENLLENAKLHTIEANAETAAKTQQLWKEHGLHQKVNWHVGEALQIIPTLKIKPDLIFVDADKQNYQSYLNLCLPMLSNNGIMLFDNTLWSGRVALEYDRNHDRDTQTIHQFNTYAHSLGTIYTTLLPIRDGITLITKKL